MPSKTLDIDGQSLQGWLVNLELAWPGQNFVVIHKLGPPFWTDLAKTLWHVKLTKWFSACCVHGNLLGDNDRQNHLFPWDMFSTPSTNQTRSCQQPTTGLGRWATAQESASLYTHVHTIPCSGVRPPQTPEQTRDHATVETETHYIYNLYNIILVNYNIYMYSIRYQSQTKWAAMGITEQRSS